MQAESQMMVISYSRDDLLHAEKLQEALERYGYFVWRDLESIRGGQNWPKALGEAIADSDVFLLVWSKHAQGSHFIEFEWSTAIALRKQIIPCHLDETELHPSLSSFNSLPLKNFNFDSIFKSIQIPVPPTSTEKRLEVLNILETITSTEPEVAIKVIQELMLPPVWNVPYIRNKNFAGREKILTELRDGYRGTALSQVIYGLGGIGKTQIALEYLYRHKSSYGVIWWLPAENPKTLAEKYAEIANHLPELQIQPNQKLSDLTKSVRYWFGKNTNWLLVFDNVGTPSDIRDYLPQVPTGHILITTRNPDWKELQIRCIKVHEWNPEESVKFLCQRSGDKDEKAAKALSKELGNLPLAIEQASAYISLPVRTIAKYLELFKSNRKKLWGKEKAPADYNKTVSTTWKMAMDQLEEDESARAAPYILKLGAYLSPDGIPRSFFDEENANLPKPLLELAADPFAIDDGIAALYRYSILDVNLDTLSIHRLVQTVVRDSLSDNQKKSYAESAVKIVDNVFPNGPYGDSQIYSTCVALLPHVETVRDHMNKNNLNRQYVSFLQKYLSFLKVRRDYQRRDAAKKRRIATELSKKAAEAKVKADKSRMELDKATVEVERKIQKFVAEIKKAPQGLDNSKLVQNFNKLESILQGIPQTDTIETTYYDIVLYRETLMGPDHPGFPRSLYNFAGFLYKKGKYNEAEPIFKRAVKLMKAQLGHDHPDVVAVLTELENLFHD